MTRPRRRLDFQFFTIKRRSPKTGSGAVAMPQEVRNVTERRDVIVATLDVTNFYGPPVFLLRSVRKGEGTRERKKRFRFGYGLLMQHICG